MSSWRRCRRQLSARSDPSTFRCSQTGACIGPPTNLMWFSHQQPVCGSVGRHVAHQHCYRIQLFASLALGLRADFGSRIAISEKMVRKDCPWWRLVDSLRSWQCLGVPVSRLIFRTLVDNDKDKCFTFDKD